MFGSQALGRGQTGADGAQGQGSALQDAEGGIGNGGDVLGVQLGAKRLEVNSTMLWGLRRTLVDMTILAPQRSGTVLRVGATAPPSPVGPGQRGIRFQRPRGRWPRRLPLASVRRAPRLPLASQVCPHRSLLASDLSLVADHRLDGFTARPQSPHAGLQVASGAMTSTADYRLDDLDYQPSYSLSG